MIDTKALREKILDLAIRGKLVPQDPNDEPASVLLERIRAQKQQMVKEGKLKAKDIKNDTIIFKGEDNLHYEQFQDGTVKCIEDEIPFEIPEGWAWTRLGTAFTTLTGSTPSTQDKSLYGNEYPFYKPTDLDYGFYIECSKDMVSLKGYNNGRITPQHSILVTCIGATIGKTGFVRNAGICNQQINAIVPNPLVYMEYFYFLFCSKYMQQSIKANASATTLPILNKSGFDNLLVPMSPLKQQEKITNAIIDTFSFVENIEKDADFLEKCISVIKSKILDLAIRGKLVPQDPNDEPASVLLERIKAEKEELIKQGKIKRDKKESVIFKGEDNSYYQDLPKNWELVAFSNIADLISGRDLKPEEYNSDRIGIPYITGASNFNEGNILINRWTTSPKSISIKNDILLSCKGTVGELAINDYDKIHIARQIMAIRVSTKINLKYIKLFFESMILEIKKSADGLIPGISRDDILSLDIPLPPIAEQKRIVEAIEAIFAQLNEITDSIS